MKLPKITSKVVIITVILLILSPIIITLLPLFLGGILIWNRKKFLPNFNKLGFIIIVIFSAIILEGVYILQFPSDNKTSQNTASITSSSNSAYSLLTDVKGTLDQISNTSTFSTSSNSSSSILSITSSSSKASTSSITISSQDTSQKTTNTKQAEQKYYVSRIIDGDTIEVLLNDQKYTIRVIGIDTPETVSPNAPVECFGPEASSKAKQLLLNKSVYLISDASQGDLDKYKRLLRYITYDDKMDFGHEMIAGGYAREYTYDKVYNNSKDYKSAENIAKTNSLGLWSPNTCNGTKISTKTQGNTNSVSTQTSVYSNIPTKTSSTTIINQPVEPTGKYACNCSKLCSDIPAKMSCDEAQYQLKVCGCSARDADKDGHACDTQCK